MIQVASCCVVPVRHLNLHEYQSKRLMKQYGINTQHFEMAETPEEAGRVAKELGKLKWQWHALQEPAQ